MNLNNTYTGCSTEAWPKGGSRLGMGCIPIIPVLSGRVKKKKKTNPYFKF